MRFFCSQPAWVVSTGTVIRFPAWFRLKAETVPLRLTALASCSPLPFLSNPAAIGKLMLNESIIGSRIAQDGAH